MDEEEFDKWLVADLDGTLANDAHRNHLIPDWDSYHELSAQDAPFEQVCDLVIELSENHPLLIITERHERYRGTTEKWLAEHGIAPDVLLMRPDDNYQTVSDLKMEMLTNICDGEEFEKIFVVIEDNDKIVELFRNKGLLCLQPRIG